MTDFSTYLPPGVYTSEDQTPMVNLQTFTPNLVALVGPSVGYRRHTEAVTLAGTTAVTLSHLGVDEATVVVRSVDGLTTYVVDDDYALVEGEGADEDSLTAADNEWTIARVGGGDITAGAVVRVSYQYTDPDYFNPRRLSDYDDIKDAFGEPIDPITGAITSPLSFAAKIAMDNGATDLVLVATDSASATAVIRTELSDALDLLLANYDVNIVVPLPAGITGDDNAPGDVINVGDDLAAHVDAASADNNFRVGIVGYDGTVTVTPDSIAQGIASKRVMLAWPNKLSWYNGFAQRTVTVSGIYLAAAYAGRLAALRTQDGLTRKQVNGFTGIEASAALTLTPTNKNAWSAAGVAVLEATRRRGLVVRHGTSTDPTNVNTREVSVVRIRDAVVRGMNEAVENSGIIGAPIVEETPLRVKTIIAGVLEQAKDNELIIGYQNLKSRLSQIDPSVIEIKFEYQPSYPLNYVLIVFSINTQTGEIAA